MALTAQHVANSMSGYLDIARKTLARLAEANTGAAAGYGDNEAPDLFADWVLRPDVTGRLGCEAPDLAEADRWWARATFDELPDAGRFLDFPVWYGKDTGHKGQHPI